MVLIRLVSVLTILLTAGPLYAQEPDPEYVPWHAHADAVREVLTASQRPSPPTVEDFFRLFGKSNESELELRTIRCMENEGKSRDACYQQATKVLNRPEKFRSMAYAEIISRLHDSGSFYVSTSYGKQPVDPFGNQLPYLPIKVLSEDRELVFMLTKYEDDLEYDGYILHIAVDGKKLLSEPGHQ